MLGGGALLDIGVYLISFAHLILGARRRILASNNPSVTGVDSQTSVMLEYASGQQALLLMSFEANTPGRATINGTRARIEIDSPFFRPAGFRLVDRDGQTESWSEPHDGLELWMTTMYQIRDQIGLSYPSTTGTAEQSDRPLAIATCQACAP
jgi:predicted dehydrogenase